ncbi:MAG: hypothetical protein IJS22_08340 [Lachnospiraceae bacterium]|nr:hypothetical protein [Lachnospiraceae bacterium]
MACFLVKKTKGKSMKKTSLIIRCIILFLLLGSVLSNSLLIASASSTDSYFSFAVGGDLANRTLFRTKDNSTPVYVKLDNGPSLVLFDVVASNLVSQNSGTGVAHMSPGTQRLIHTHVYENGHAICALMSRNNPYSGTASGYWSPDSVGTYPFAN